MPSFEIKREGQKPSGSGPNLPSIQETKPLPSGHQYRPGSIDVKAVRLAYKMKKGFSGMA
jgi:hypothetical protein